MTLLLIDLDQGQLTLCVCFHLNKVTDLSFTKNSLLVSSLYQISYNWEGPTKA